MFKKKPIGNLIGKLKDKRTSNKKDGDENGTIRSRINNELDNTQINNNSKLSN